MATLIAKKKPAIDDAGKLTGPEKAAVILLALGEEHQSLWTQLDDEEIKEISQAMSGLGTVSAAVVENLLMEFVSGMSSTGAIMGSFEGTQRLLSSILPSEKVDSLMEEIRGPAGRTMWDKLGNVNEAVLANYLKNEYPQTVAVVLSKIKSEHASRVLSALPEDFALECVQRMLLQTPLHPVNPSRIVAAEPARPHACNAREIMQATDPTTPAPPPFRRRTNPLILLLAILILTAGILGGLWLKYYRVAPANNRAGDLAATGFTPTPVAHKLDARYTDADGDLVADAPTDPAKLISPATITFSYVAVEDAEKSRAAWKPFCDYLSKATGHPVEYVLLTSTNDEIKAMRDGKLCVAGFNSGAVPSAVNRAGFVPVCGVPTPDGSAMTHTAIIVPADSPLRSPTDLKGRELTLTDPSSNSGYKAPLVMLRSKFNLQPLSDVMLRYSGSHESSIAGIANHHYEAAAVAADMLDRETAAGHIKPDQYRIIYASDAFPTAGLGYAYNLAPDLAKKVREALLSFDWKGTSLEAELASTKSTKFVPVNYKDNWTLIRSIDDQMGFAQKLD